MKNLRVFYLGNVPYNLSLEIQDLFLRKRINGETEDSLLLVEHPHTFTIGRSGNEENLLVNEYFLGQNNIQLVRISRGGDITYHGPGQLVGYPVFNLNDHLKDIHWYLRNLEEVIIRCLGKYNISARRIEKLTGVWVKRSKIASIGVGIKRWTTYHGFALNINTDLGMFDMINPCGLKQVHMTSLRQLLGDTEDVDIPGVSRIIIHEFMEVYDFANFAEYDFSTTPSDALYSELEKTLEVYNHNYA